MPPTSTNDFFAFGLRKVKRWMMSSSHCRRSWIPWRQTGALCSCRSKHCRGIVNLAELNYSFPSNHGSGKLLYLKGNCYWRDPFLTSMIMGGRVFFSYSNIAGRLRTLWNVQMQKASLDMVAFLGQLFYVGVPDSTFPYLNVWGFFLLVGQFAPLEVQQASSIKGYPPVN